LIEAGLRFRFAEAASSADANLQRRLILIATAAEMAGSGTALLRQVARLRAPSGVPDFKYLGEAMVRKRRTPPAVQAAQLSAAAHTKLDIAALRDQ
jgi:hypothetical protein